MNNTWLAFTALLLVVLIAVAVGAQQMDAQRLQEISQLKAKNEDFTRIALELQEQRDQALVDRDEAVGKVDGLVAENAMLREDLRNQNSVADNRQQEIDRLVNEKQALQTRNMEIETQIANLTQSPLPVTGNRNTVTEQAGIVAETNGICLQVRTQSLPEQLGLGIAVLVGLAALGSGGYLYFRHDPNRKYPVKMTREQIKEYARYQRERGNQAG
jgi:cell division protein FtsB